MKAIRYILIILCIVSALPSVAQITYADAARRADRFFGYREWASASALYNFMLKEKPEVPDTYGRAIVVNSMLNDTVRPMQLLSQAMAYNIPLDSVLSQVQKYSFIVGRGDLYERFMLQAAHDNHWLSRPLDNQLLKYYTFRNNGPKMVQYALTMLKGVPNDTRFLSTLAKGYMLEGKTQQAVDTWRKIVSIDPNDYQTLLCLANYYKYIGEDAVALPYFDRAQQIQPTPYVAAIIDGLRLTMYHLR